MLARIAITALLLAAGCAVNPVSGRPEFTVLSQKQELELGEEEAKNVAASMGLVDDPALTAYVRAVGDRVARFSPRKDVRYTFSVVEMEEPNAFALPGGYVYVSRGLLTLSSSEDELAGVLGHEIGHVAARHSVRRVTRAAPLGILTGLGALATGIVSPLLGNVVGAIGGAANEFLLAPYSRGQENEADRVGQDMVAKAGWDPSGISRMLRTLEREEASHGNAPRGMDFFATHPPLPHRVEHTTEHAKTLQRGPAHPIAGTRRAYLDKLEGLVVGPRAAEGVFVGETFLHPDLGFHIRFPSGWKTANGRSIVGAGAPDGKAAVAVEVIGKGNDPEDGLRAFERHTKLSLDKEADRLRVNGLPAVHAATAARTDDGRVAVDLTWIALGGHVYQVTGLTSPSHAKDMRETFAATVNSFGPLTDAERPSIREKRLEVATAEAGETLSALVARTGSAWNADFTAIANGIEAAAPLRGGDLVKVAVEGPYRGK